MIEQLTNVLEIVMLILYTLGRMAATVALVWLILSSRITLGWQVFLISLTVVVGMGFSVKYHNPNEKHDPLFPETHVEEQK